MTLYGYDRLYEEVAARLASTDMSAFLGRHESPIEELMGRALLVDHIIGNRAGRDISKDESCDVIFEQQAKIDKFRVDFLLRVRCHLRDRIGIVVECDGHEFHERTKEQAARDKSRDRRLAELGYTVLRFTGSEIYRNPLACASQVWGVVSQASFKGVDWSAYDHILKEIDQEGGDA